MAFKQMPLNNPKQSVQLLEGSNYPEEPMTCYCQHASYVGPHFTRILLILKVLSTHRLLQKANPDGLYERFSFEFCHKLTQDSYFHANY